MSLDFMMWFLAAVTFHGPKVKSCLLLLKPCDIIVDREANINCKRDHERMSVISSGYCGRKTTQWDGVEVRDQCRPVNGLHHTCMLTFLIYMSVL